MSLITCQAKFSPWMPLSQLLSFPLELRCLHTYSKLWNRSNPKELWNPPHHLSDFIYFGSSLNYQSSQFAHVWSMETPFLLCLAFPRRAGIHTCAIHSAACQYTAATQFPRNCNGSFDAQSYCSAEINREMFGPSNHGDAYNLLQSNSANRILTRTSSVVNA